MCAQLRSPPETLRISQSTIVLRVLRTFVPRGLRRPLIGPPYTPASRTAKTRDFPARWLIEQYPGSNYVPAPGCNIYPSERMAPLGIIWAQFTAPLNTLGRIYSWDVRGVLWEGFKGSPEMSMRSVNELSFFQTRGCGLPCTKRLELLYLIAALEIVRCTRV